MAYFRPSSKDFSQLYNLITVFFCDLDLWLKVTNHKVQGYMDLDMTEIHHNLYNRWIGFGKHFVSATNLNRPLSLELTKGQKHN